MYCEHTRACARHGKPDNSNQLAGGKLLLSRLSSRTARLHSHIPGSLQMVPGCGILQRWPSRNSTQAKGASTACYSSRRTRASTPHQMQRLTATRKSPTTTCPTSSITTGCSCSVGLSCATAARRTCTGRHRPPPRDRTLLLRGDVHRRAEGVDAGLFLAPFGVLQPEGGHVRQVYGHGCEMGFLPQARMHQAPWRRLHVLFADLELRI